MITAVNSIELDLLATISATAGGKRSVAYEREATAGETSESFLSSDDTQSMSEKLRQLSLYQPSRLVDHTESGSSHESIPGTAVKVPLPIIQDVAAAMSSSPGLKEENRELYQALKRHGKQKQFFALVNELQELSPQESREWKDFLIRCDANDPRGQKLREQSRHAGEELTAEKAMEIIESRTLIFHKDPAQARKIRAAIREALAVYSPDNLMLLAANNVNFLTEVPPPAVAAFLGIPQIAEDFDYRPPNHSEIVEFAKLVAMKRGLKEADAGWTDDQLLDFIQAHAPPMARNPGLPIAREQILYGIVEYFRNKEGKPLAAGVCCAGDRGNLFLTVPFWLKCYDIDDAHYRKTVVHEVAHALDRLKSETGELSYQSMADPALNAHFEHQKEVVKRDPSRNWNNYAFSNVKEYLANAVEFHSAGSIDLKKADPELDAFADMFIREGAFPHFEFSDR